MKIAVIGTGIAGLGAAWRLHERHDLTVYEANDRIGGHSNTVAMPDGTPVDTGFIVYNNRTYPNLIQLFSTLKVPTEDSDMSFAVSADNGRLEYSGNNLLSLFCQRRNLVKPSFHGMIKDILRFYRNAPKQMAAGGTSGMTLGEYLAHGRYGQGFVYDHLLPMGAAIWSASIADMMAFPAESFIRFFDNHGLMQLLNRPIWRTVTGGSREYVTRLSVGFTDRIRTGCAVVRVERTSSGAIVTDRSGDAAHYDAVVFASHGDQTRRLISDPTPQEHAILSAFRYQQNRAVLHTDPKQMPRRRRAWASWNYLANETRSQTGAVAVTYWMNLLQNLKTSQPVFVTLNPMSEPTPSSVTAEFVYDHPMFDTAAITAQQQLRSIQGRDRYWYCGSYCGYGFHEDGLASGLAVAEALGTPRPWAVADMSPAFENATPIPAMMMAAAAE